MSKYFDADQFIDVLIEPLPQEVVKEIDVVVPMRDGVCLSANVFRPAKPGRYPAILSISPYGKDGFRQTDNFKPVPGVHLGHYELSDAVAFEAPDPGYWVPQGYAVIHADTRGQGKSGGDTGPFTPQDQRDYFDYIEWAAVQPWCSGKTGLCGVSYLAISQWLVAQLRPPHLKAMIPWEGMNDFYLRSYFGGIREGTFNDFVWNGWVVPQHNPLGGFSEPDWLSAQTDHPLRDEYWRKKEIDLEAITTPALICASFSDQGLHTRDTFEAFNRISSPDKWLFSHRRCKWAAFYGEEECEYQRRFFDHFLKGTGDLNDLPRVRVEVYETRTTFKVLHAKEWPIENTRYTPLYLASAGQLSTAEQPQEAVVSYDSATETGTSFDYRFETDTDLVGNMKLKLWVSSEDADDMDLFVAVQKLDESEEQVYFYGFGGTNPNDVVARGWLRVSHRELDTERSTPSRPVHKHAQRLKLRRKEIVPVEIEILPSGTTFRRGQFLRVVIKGLPIKPDSPLLGFPDILNRGYHQLQFGGQYDSHLLIPVVQ